MVAPPQRRGLPLVELRRATPFVRITEAVHALIVDAQLTELRATEEIHQRFTELSVEGAEPAEVVRQAAELAGCPVVLENLSRQVLGVRRRGRQRRAAARRLGAALAADPAGRADRVRPGHRLAGDHRRRPRAATGAGCCCAGRRDAARLEPPPPTRLTILIERAASTLALGRLIRRDAEGLERQIHRTLLTALLDHTRPVDEVALRARRSAWPWTGGTWSASWSGTAPTTRRAVGPEAARPGCAISPRRSARRCGSAKLTA